MSSLQVLSAVARANEKLIAHSLELDRNSLVESTLDGVSPRTWISGTHSMIAYVEAYLKSGEVYVWYLDVDWNGQDWEIAASLKFHARRGGDQETVVELPSRTGSDDGRFVTELEDAVDELLRIDLSAASVARQRLSA